MSSATRTVDDGQDVALAHHAPRLRPQRHNPWAGLYEASDAAQPRRAPARDVANKIAAHDNANDSVDESTARSARAQRLIAGNENASAIRTATITPPQSSAAAVNPVAGATTRSMDEAFQSLGSAKRNGRCHEEVADLSYFADLRASRQLSERTGVRGRMSVDGGHYRPNTTSRPARISLTLATGAGHSFSQGSSVDREYLRYIRDGIFEDRNREREQHVAGCVGPSQVAGERNADHRGNKTSVDVNRLAGPRRVSKSGSDPEGLEGLIHRSLPARLPFAFSRCGRAVALTKSVSMLDFRTKLRFIASVISSGEWRATYSRNAALYTFASRSTPRRARRSTFRDVIRNRDSCFHTAV